MDFKIQFRVYEGDNLLQISEEKTHPLIQDFLYENDYVLLVAKEKIGKSILALQLACNLSSGTPFLDTLEITKPVKVWYFATEGKDNDIKQRLVNMTKVIPMNKNNFKLICSAGLRINTPEDYGGMTSLLKRYKDELPKVIIIDPLYMAVKGSLKDDNVINDFTHIMRRVAEACDASILIIHHSKRPFRMTDGSIMTLGDDEIFGSAFLKASVDHVFYMGNMTHTLHKFLKCETQRSGNIIDTMELRLHELSPLYFEQIETSKDELIKGIEELLMKHKTLTVPQLAKYLDVSRVSIYTNIKKIKGIHKTNTRPVLYHINGT